MKKIFSLILALSLCVTAFGFVSVSAYTGTSKLDFEASGYSGLISGKSYTPNASTGIKSITVQNNLTNSITSSGFVTNNPSGNKYLLINSQGKAASTTEDVRINLLNPVKGHFIIKFKMAFKETYSGYPISTVNDNFIFDTRAYLGGARGGTDSASSSPFFRIRENGSVLIPAKESDNVPVAQTAYGFVDSSRMFTGSNNIASTDWQDMKIEGFIENASLRPYYILSRKMKGDSEYRVITKDWVMSSSDGSSGTIPAYTSDGLTAMRFMISQFRQGSCKPSSDYVQVAIDDIEFECDDFKVSNLKGVDASGNALTSASVLAGATVYPQFTAANLTKDNKNVYAVIAAYDNRGIAQLATKNFAVAPNQTLSVNSSSGLSLTCGSNTKEVRVYTFDSEGTMNALTTKYFTSNVEKKVIEPFAVIDFNNATKNSAVLAGTETSYTGAKVKYTSGEAGAWTCPTGSNGFVTGNASGNGYMQATANASKAGTLEITFGSPVRESFEMDFKMQAKFNTIASGAKVASAAYIPQAHTVMRLGLRPSVTDKESTITNIMYVDGCGGIAAVGCDSVNKDNVYAWLFNVLSSAPGRYSRGATGIHGVAVNGATDQYLSSKFSTFPWENYKIKVNMSSGVPTYQVYREGQLLTQGSCATSASGIDISGAYAKGIEAIRIYFANNPDGAYGYSTYLTGSQSIQFAFDDITFTKTE